MTILTIGINHKTAPVALREKVAFSPDNINDGLTSLIEDAACQEAAILSTCNRTEIYVSAKGDKSQDVVNWLQHFHGIDAEQLSASLYVHKQDDAVDHLMQVASGLDSLILGEPQILGQVKQAYNQAKFAGTMNMVLDRLFQHTFSVAKRVRTETDIGGNAVSVAFAAVNLAKHIFGELKANRVLLIGAGETIELVARHLQDNGVTTMTVANRTIQRAEKLAEEFNGKAVSLAQIPEAMVDADIIVSSTASTLPILGKGMVESALKKRKHAPMLLIDLAVPRDIESEVDSLDDAYLYTVDDLQEIVSRNLENRKQAALEAKKIVHQEVAGFSGWYQSLDSIDYIRTYRQQSEQQRDRLLERARAQLASGENAEAVLKELAVKLTNNLMHSPTKALGEAAKAGDSEKLTAISQILGLQK